MKTKTKEHRLIATSSSSTRSIMLHRLDQRASLDTIFYIPSRKLDKCSISSLKRSVIQDSISNSEHPLSRIANSRSSQAQNEYFAPFVNERSTTGRLINSFQSTFFFPSKKSSGMLELPPSDTASSFFPVRRTNYTDAIKSQGKALSQMVAFPEVGEPIQSPSRGSEKAFTYSKRVNLRTKQQKRVSETRASSDLRKILTFASKAEKPPKLKHASANLLHSLTLVRMMNRLPKYSVHKQQKITRYMRLMESVRMLQKKLTTGVSMQKRRKTRVLGSRFVQLGILLLLNTPSLMVEITERIVNDQADDESDMN